MAALAQRRERGGEVPVERRRRQHEGLVRRRKGIAQVLAVNALAHAVGARLEDRDQASRPDVRGQRLEGGGDGRGVMGEVIEHLDASGDAP